MKIIYFKNNLPLISFQVICPYIIPSFLPSPLLPSFIHSCLAAKTNIGQHRVNADLTFINSIILKHHKCACLSTPVSKHQPLHLRLKTRES